MYCCCCYYYCWINFYFLPHPDPKLKKNTQKVRPVATNLTVIKTSISSVNYFIENIHACRNQTNEIAHSMSTRCAVRQNVTQIELQKKNCIYTWIQFAAWFKNVIHEVTNPKTKTPNQKSIFDEFLFVANTRVHELSPISISNCDLFIHLFIYERQRNEK